MTLEQPQIKTRFIELAVTPDRKLRADIQEVPLRRLKLDPNNVRFHHLAEPLSDSEIEEKIWGENDTRDLFREILASRGLTEPPIVDSNYSIREGNRRIVCLRKLNEKTRKGEYATLGIREDLWDTVTCYVLPRDTSEKDVAILLGRFHVSGKKTWRALNIAAHVSELYSKHGLKHEDIRDYLSMSKTTVGRMIKAFEATTEYGKRYTDDKEWLGKFSYFYEAYKKKKLTEWLAKNGNPDRFMDWLGKDRLTRGEQVRKLSDIILIPDALDALDKKGFQAAIAVLSKTDPSVDNKFYGAVRDMVEQLNHVPREELIAAGSDQAKIQALQRLRDTVDDVLRNISAIKER